MFLMHRYLVQSAHNLIHQYTPSVHRQISSNLLQTHVVNTSLSFTDRWQSVTLPPSPSTISWLQMESMTSRGCLKSQRSACMPVSNENQSSIFLSCFSRQVVTRNLNRIIDVNHYPVPEVHIIVLVSLPGILFKQKNLVEFEQILSLLSSSGWIFQQTSQTHWHWGSGSSWCFHPDAIPFWEPWGSRPEQEDFWDHLLWCPHSILRAGQTWWSIWYLQGITSQQGRKCTGNYFTVCT